jgi:S-adenosylmethionine:tRNA ribosyltransferase-isomerase
MRTDDFDYHLPQELIAQTPLEPRDASRLLLIDRAGKTIAHRAFCDLPEMMVPGDVLVFNDSRVIAARLKARKETGGMVEILLLRRDDDGAWESLIKHGKRVVAGSRLEMLDANGNDETGVSAELLEKRPDGVCRVKFSDDARLPELGIIPLPPYIKEKLERPERYQTVYAEAEGSAAAPTAGLHFTPEILRKLEDAGVKCLFVTLHVGLDTFRPVRVDDPREHPIHREYGAISADVAAEIASAKQAGRRVIAVGTTATRLIEATGGEEFRGWVDIFIYPGYRYRVVDAMLTNFHLPRSTLLMMVSAFAGKELLDRAYRQAIAERYRFYSFGDAMLIL